MRERQETFLNRSELIRKRADPAVQLESNNQLSEIDKLSSRGDLGFLSQRKPEVLYDVMEQVGGGMTEA